MIFKETPLKGAYTIELQKREDDRGFFARFFCVNEYTEHGLDHNIVQINNSFTKQKFTFRGFHYQLPPKAEVRIVRCIRGAVFDMMIDLRPQSPTFCKYFGIELNEENRTMTYIPKGFAHGFMTLRDNTEFLYLVTEFYSPEHERVIRYDDPKFKIKLPAKPVNVSPKDSTAPDFDTKTHLVGMETLKI